MPSDTPVLPTTEPTPASQLTPAPPTAEPPVYSHGKLPPGVIRKPYRVKVEVKPVSRRAKFHALTHVPTSPEKRRLNQLATYRSMIARGDLVMAEEYARTHALEVPMATLVDDLVGELPPTPQTGVPPPMPPPAPKAAATGMPDQPPPTGWPEHARVVVWTTCPNPKLVVARLPDGRQVSLWREGLPTRPVGIECDVHIEKRTGDPIYRLDPLPTQ